MNSKLLALLLVGVAFFQIGCDKDKNKPTKAQKAMINSCMYDPTGQCQQRAKAMLENRGVQAQLNAQYGFPAPGSQWAATNPTYQNPAVTNNTTPNLTGNPPAILPASIEEQAAKIKAQLEADSKNPRSLYYDPEPGSSAVDRTPASVAEQPASTAEMPVAILPASTGGGSGEGAIREDRY